MNDDEFDRAASVIEESEGTLLKTLAIAVKDGLLSACAGRARAAQAAKAGHALDLARYHHSVGGAENEQNTYAEIVQARKMLHSEAHSLHALLEQARGPAHVGSRLAAQVRASTTAPCSADADAAGRLAAEYGLVGGRRHSQALEEAGRQ